MSDSTERKTYGIFANSANRKIIGELENLDFNVKLFPPIETEKVALNETSKEKLKNLKNFDWLIFPDVLAVDYFLEILEENHSDLFELDELRVCAAGEAVADRLRFSSVHSDVIPESIQTESVFAPVANYIGVNSTADLRFLLPREISMQTNLPERLNAVGAVVCEMPIYQIRSFPNLEITKLKTLLKGGAIDEFIFASPIDFIALKYWFGNEEISAVMADTKISAIDGVMYQYARENNLLRAGLFHLATIDKVKR